MGESPWKSVERNQLQFSQNAKWHGLMCLYGRGEDLNTVDIFLCFSPVLPLYHYEKNVAEQEFKIGNSDFEQSSWQLADAGGKFMRSCLSALSYLKQSLEVTKEREAKGYLRKTIITMLGGKAENHAV
jgi:hypothetical protein